MKISLTLNGTSYEGNVNKISSYLPKYGELLQAEGQDKVYYCMDWDYKLRHIINMEIFNKMGNELGFRWGDQKYITREEMESIELGDPILRWPETEPIPPIRLMYGVHNSGDYSRVVDAGCNALFRPGFDSLSVAMQETHINRCNQLGLKICWNLWGGDWTHRDETIIRWKDDPAVLCWYYITEPYLEGSGCYLDAEQQRIRHQQFADLAGPEKPFMQDRGLWNPHPDYFAEDALDILMLQSYPYEFPNDIDMYYNRTLLNLLSLKTKSYPVIPLIQCFWAGNYKKPPTGGVAFQHNRWKELLQSKGWFGDHLAFYLWSGYSGNDIKNNDYLYNEIREINKEL